ncbi:MAG: hypothetical protein AB7S68_25915, partial [Polyangiaceae bacterium]
MGTNQNGSRGTELAHAKGLGVRTGVWSLVLAGLTVWLGACGIVTIKPANAGTETEVSRQRPARYDGAECYQVLYTPDESRERHERQQDYSPEAQVLLATCARSEYRGQEQEEKVDDVQFIDYYQTFDERKPDPVLLAAMAINARFDGQRAIREDMRSRGFDKDEYEQAGDALISLMLNYVDEPKLTQALAGVNVPEDAKQALIENFREAKSYFAHETNQLEGALKELLLDTPKAVQKRRDAAFEAQAANWATFDGYAARIKQSTSKQGGDPELLKDLQALRVKVVESAKGDYLEDPL